MTMEWSPKGMMNKCKCGQIVASTAFVMDPEEWNGIRHSKAGCAPIPGYVSGVTITFGVTLPAPPHAQPAQAQADSFRQPEGGDAHAAAPELSVSGGTRLEVTAGPSATAPAAPQDEARVCADCGGSGIVGPDDLRCAKCAPPEVRLFGLLTEEDCGPLRYAGEDVSEYTVAIDHIRAALAAARREGAEAAAAWVQLGRWHDPDSCAAGIRALDLAAPGAEGQQSTNADAERK
jgi:hypothetical protein